MPFEFGDSSLQIIHAELIPSETSRICHAVTGTFLNVRERILTNTPQSRCEEENFMVKASGARGCKPGLKHPHKDSCRLTRIVWSTPSVTRTSLHVLFSSHTLQC